MKNIFKIIYIFVTILIFTIFLIGSIIGIFLFNKASDASLFLKEPTEQIKIYDHNDNLITSTNIQYEYVSIKDINQNIINAFIAIEDRNFYTHKGFSLPRILKTTWNNLSQRKITAGASTITQQYVKNSFLTTEQTIKRKLTELTYAIELEKKYSKDQILEAYLNTILFGGNIYGIKMACRYYFNTTPNEATITQAATLAGMVQMPNYYHPYNNPDITNERKNIVLQCMLEEKYISQTEYQKSKQTNVKDITTKNQIIKGNYLTPYIDYIYHYLTDINNPIKEIKTYLDIEIQKQIYNILSNQYQIFNNDKINSAILVLDNKDYGIKALAGNRCFNQKVLDYATNIKLQPGSTIKPLLDYAPAFEYLNYNPATIINDEPYTYKNGTSVKNYDNKYLGKITIRKALSDSRNIPAIKLFNEVTPEKAFGFLEKLGIKPPQNIFEAEAIGGSSSGYTLLELTNAYQAFANLGYYKKASPIKEIKYSTYTTKNEEKPKLVMKPATAFLINSILHDVFKNSNYDLKNTFLMAKTGQTNYDIATQQKYNIPKSATKDSLLIAYTKDLTIGIWVGYEKIEYNQYLDYYQKNIPRIIMKLLLDEFAKPNQYYEIIDDIKKCFITIYNDKAYLAKENGYYEFFPKGTEPLSYPNYYDKT